MKKFSQSVANIFANFFKIIFLLSFVVPLLWFFSSVFLDKEFGIVLQEYWDWKMLQMRIAFYGAVLHPFVLELFPALGIAQGIGYSLVEVILGVGLIFIFIAIYESLSDLRRQSEDSQYVLAALLGEIKKMNATLEKAEFGRQQHEPKVGSEVYPQKIEPKIYVPNPTSDNEEKREMRLREILLNSSYWTAKIKRLKEFFVR